ncbi:alcohol dehydrogenase catalytic domain-containing protein (plasmid) [Streptomyces sp. NBC_00841]|uniref:alcohol dehydrogenase catalytic domain-containing protein n=1 Tax=unclassified Streptomyces TaxID=2593676 RepID=UPI0022502048|nr:MULTISPECIES: alcohol dehydrogenase catalytic domain-containing protein [unclassified Streptomyces]MCX4538638.1 alcohol dehydrogenase catalytic domain-containing protein [Streptomyces sp. NBC_01669]WSA05545.1 alcohol dehydrogenase catalytic domain-containing protein [Streptomyces sp. NBC_00841]
MLAARWHGRGDLRVEQVELRPTRDDEVLVKVHWCGICGTDLEEFRAGPLIIPADAPHPGSGRMAPLTLGHEVVGEVVVAARDGSGPAVGTLVVPDVVNGCGRCWWCLRHEEGLCPELSVPGQQDDGGLAEYMVARARTCVPLPEGLAPERAVLAEPAAVAVRAVRKAPSPMGATALVIGGGTVGQLAAQAALATGATRCWLVDPSPFRRAHTESHGATRACAPDELDALLAELGPPGFDVVYECSGAPGQLDRALTACRRGGTVVAVGLGGERHAISLPELVLGERYLVGSAAHLWDVDVALAVHWLADGRFTTDGLVTHRVPLPNLVDAALPLLTSPSGDVLKVAIDCQV